MFVYVFYIKSVLLPPNPKFSCKFTQIWGRMAVKLQIKIHKHLFQSKFFWNFTKKMGLPHYDACALLPPTGRLSAAHTEHSMAARSSFVVDLLVFFFFDGKLEAAHCDVIILYICGRLLVVTLSTTFVSHLTGDSPFLHVPLTTRFSKQITRRV